MVNVPKPYWIESLPASPWTSVAAPSAVIWSSPFPPLTVMGIARPADSSRALAITVSLPSPALTTTELTDAVGKNCSWPFTSTRNEGTLFSPT
jgi:hypothetical protein